jgi:hypothetical protein
MPQQEDTLSQLLKKEFGTGSFMKPSYCDFSNSELHNEIVNTYKKLNGQLEIYPVAFRGFDIELPNCIIELDEAQHFNRYRGLTLDSKIYKDNNSFSTSAYKSFCNQFETECLKKGDNRKYWKTNSTEIQFGKSAADGILSGDGSSRWRQRAFYDFLRDAGQQIGKYKLIRISVYQKIKEKTIDEILNKNLKNYFPELLKLIEEKIKTN